jgi:hypothetical protein
MIAKDRPAPKDSAAGGSAVSITQSAHSREYVIMLYNIYSRN